MLEPTDTELMLRAREGDVAAFHQLTVRYREPLQRFFVVLLGDRALAEDCVQETFLRLWFLRERYEPTGKFSTYLFQIGKNHGLNQRKKIRPQPLSEEREGAETVQEAESSQPELILIRRDRRERIRCAIAALPELYRVVFEMSQFERLRYAEIARRLGLPIGTVKSRRAEAVRRLREALYAQEEDEQDG